MIAEFYQLLEDLKNNYSDELLEKTLSFYNENIPVDSLYDNLEKSKELLNGQNSSFYNYFAQCLVNDFNHSPDFYFLASLPFLELLNEKEYNQILDLAKNIDNYSSDATDYLNGIIELKNGNADIALFHFNRVEHYCGDYFKGLCYFDQQNFENSIKNLECFLQEFKKTIIKISKANENVNLENNNSYRFIRRDILGLLGYAYNRIKEFQKAKSCYEESLKYADLEILYLSEFDMLEESKMYTNGFLSFVNNYLYSLKKTNDLKKSIEVLDFVIEKIPHDIYFQNLKARFEKKLENQSFADEIIQKLFEPKKPFNIDKFQDVKLLSQEKSLEDMIIEQIKYGFKVFDKELEIYQDDNMFGRQYHIKSVNGRLDLLLTEKSSNTLFVIELKRNTAGIEVVNQIESYINGLKEELNHQDIKGVICVHKAEEKLIDLVKTKDDIELYTYQFNFLKCD